MFELRIVLKKNPAMNKEKPDQKENDERDKLRVRFHTNR